MADNSSGPAPAWYTTGQDGVKQERERQERMDGPRRFWCPVSSVENPRFEEFVIIDDTLFGIKEHNPKVNGEWNTHITCIAGVHEPVECCKILGPRGYQPVWTGFYTVVSLTPHKAKQSDTVYQYEVMFLPVHMRTSDKLAIKRRELGSLAGCKFRSLRTDKKSPKVGDTIEFVEKFAPEKLGMLFQYANYKGKKLTDLWSLAAEDKDALSKLKRVFQVACDPNTGAPLPQLVAFNYHRILEPMAPAEIRAVLAGASIENNETGKGGGASGGGASGSSDNVPF